MNIINYIQKNLSNRSGKNSPCPGCGRTKDGDCRWTDDGVVILCHTFIDTASGNPSYIHVRATKDGLWGIHRRASESHDVQKQVRPKSTKEYFYPSRDGTSLVKVKRIDDGEGKKKFYQFHWADEKWVKGVPSNIRQHIPIYKYQEVQEAIAQEQPIIVVEGEACADRLWDLGIAATTTLGGSKGYEKYGDYSNDLKGACLILCPDRDQPGIEYMEAIAKDFPNAQWLYPFPNSPLWAIHLPLNGGADIADWINEGATRTEILAAIGNKRTLSINDASDRPTQKAKPPEQDFLDAKKLEAEVAHLLELEPPQSQLETEIPRLAGLANRQPRDVWSLYHALKVEWEHDEERSESQKGLPQFLSTKTQHLNLFEYLPPHLAKLLTETAEAMPTAPEFLLTTFIPTSASRIGTAARIVVKASAQYVQPCIFRTVIVAPSGAKKTPAQRVVIAPLDALEQEEVHKWRANLEDYRAKCKAYEAARKNQHNGSEAEELPQTPVRTRFILTDSTIEAKVAIHSENPRGLLIYRDEWLAHLTSRDKYRHGIGDDAENELSEFNGGSLSKDRTQSSIYLERSAISRTGSTHWQTLQKVMGEHEDVTGEFARWLFCAAPCPPSYINLLDSNSDQETDLHRELQQLYQNLGKVSERDYLLSYEAKALFQDWQHQLIDWTKDEVNPGIRLAYPKFESYTARFALWLHIIHAVAQGNLTPPSVITGEMMERAIGLTRYFVDQLRFIHAYNSPQQKLTGRFLMIQEFAEGKQQPITARMVQQAFRSQFKEVSAKEIRVYFKTLANNGYGAIDGSGRRIQYRANVDHC